jgi:hypothetical protein
MGLTCLSQITALGARTKASPYFFTYRVSELDGKNAFGDYVLC